MFFHLLDLTILNSYILHSSYGGKKISHRDFQFTLVRNMLAHAGPEWRVPRPLGRPPKVEKRVARLEVCGSKHWPIPSETKLRCRVCKARGVTKCSGSAVSVKWDCALRILVLKITTQSTLPSCSSTTARGSTFTRHSAGYTRSWHLSAADTAFPSAQIHALQLRALHTVPTPSVYPHPTFQHRRIVTPLLCLILISIPHLQRTVHIAPIHTITSVETRHSITHSHVVPIHKRCQSPYHTCLRLFRKHIHQQARGPPLYATQIRFHHCKRIHHAPFTSDLRLYSHFPTT